MSRTSTILVALVFVSRAGIAAPLLGHERWRHALAAPLVTQPAVSDAGLVALVSATTLSVLDASGALVTEIAGVTPAQPMWSGETLWFRTVEGWRSWSAAGPGALCPVKAQGGIVDAAGRALFAESGELTACGPERKRVFPRRPTEGLVWPALEGWYVADDWWIESIGPNGRARGGGQVPKLGFPAGIGAQGELLLATPQGHLEARDAFLRLLWRGPRGVDGAPITTRSGALVLLADRALTLVDPPYVSWSLPVPAGVRAAAALDDGSIALLERTGHVAVVREGRVVWARALVEAGSILAAHPGGFILVQDAGALVALETPAPDAGATYALSKGYGRGSRPVVLGQRDRCPAPGPGAATKGVLHVDGFAASRDGVCVHPSLETQVEKTAGKKLFTVPCAEGCLASVGDGRVVVAAGGRVEEIDAKGRRKALVKKGPELAAVGVDGAKLLTLSREKLGVATSGRAVVYRGVLAGLDERGALWTGSDTTELRRHELPVTRGAAKGIATFGETLCANAPGRGACFVDGQPTPLLDLSPRVTWFGERAGACEDGYAICLSSAGVARTVLHTFDAKVDDLRLVGDGSLAVLSGGLVSVLWPDGSVRWASRLGSDCAGDAWLASKDGATLIARACGAIAAFETGVRGYTPSAR